MSYIYIALSYDNKSPVSHLIRIFTWSKFSHVSLIDPISKDRVIEASHTNGVALRSLSDFFSTSPPEIRRIEHPNPKAVWDTAYTQLGKEYDMGFIYGLLVRLNWQDPNKWSCSELISWAAETAGRFLFSQDRLPRITPEHLYMISEKVDEIPLDKN